MIPCVPGPKLPFVGDRYKPIKGQMTIPLIVNCRSYEDYV